MTTLSPEEDAAAGSCDPTQPFLGLRFAMADCERVLRELRKRAAELRFFFIVTPNTDHIVKLDRLGSTKLGLDLREAYGSADLCLCDSQVLAKLARISGLRLPVITGSDLTRLLFERSVIGKGSRVALVGGTAGQLEWLRGRWPEVAFFAHFPPMDVLQDMSAQSAIIAFVEEMQCDFTFFAFGAPQSELIAWHVARRGCARGVGLCVGASIEFLTGAKRRAPRWMQRLSLEWAYRLVSEPRRLGRRYLIDGPRILPIWWRSRTSAPASGIVVPPRPSPFEPRRGDEG